MNDFYIFSIKILFRMHFCYVIHIWAIFSSFDKPLLRPILQRRINENNSSLELSLQFESKAKLFPSKHTKVGNHRPTSETPFKWHFTGGPIVATHCMRVGFNINS